MAGYPVVGKHSVWNVKINEKTIVSLQNKKAIIVSRLWCTVKNFQLHEAMMSTILEGYLQRWEFSYGLDIWIYVWWKEETGILSYSAHAPSYLPLEDDYVYSNHTEQGHHAAELYLVLNTLLSCLAWVAALCQGKRRHWLHFHGACAPRHRIPGQLRSANPLPPFLISKQEHSKVKTPWDG